MLSEDIFIGPILRRAQPGMVVICLATYKPFALQFSVREQAKAEWLAHDSVPFNVLVTKNLTFYYGIVTPDKKPFPVNKLLEYGIGIINQDNSIDYKPFESIVKSDVLSYAESVLPTFFLQQPGTRLNAMYGSCRKIHDTAGGSVDALSKGDLLIEANFNKLDVRPAILCLGGDQIYADDVHLKTIQEIGKLVNKIEHPEYENPPVALPVRYSERKDYVTKHARFTSGESQNHLVTFAEYLAMYGLAWNRNNWSDPSVMEHFTSTLPAVRRLIANTPTYMIFDDHDITDDWNLHVKWQQDVRATKLGKRIVANGLMAFWLCQGFGNNPRNYTQEGYYRIGSIIENRRKDYPNVEKVFWDLNVWEFSTPTYPFIYFLDTRTERGYKDGITKTDPGAPAYLKSLTSWAATATNLRELLKRQGQNLPLVLVSATPVFGFNLIEKLQNLVSAIAGPFLLDQETWTSNIQHLKLFLRIMSNLNVVLLSGDVHYAFTSTVRAITFDDMIIRAAVKKSPQQAYLNIPLEGNNPTYLPLYTSRFLQLNSSALKNFASDTFTKKPAELTDNQGESIILSEDGEVKHYTVRGNTYQIRNKDGTYKVVFKDNIKPSLLLKQNINNAMNSRYMGDHNLGVVSLYDKTVTNYFITYKGKDSERTWDFSNKHYWD